MKGSEAKFGLGAELFGKTRSALLALLFCNTDRSFHHREIIRKINSGSGAVQKELAHLTSMGLIVRRRMGSQVHYQANEASSIFSELKSLIIKTSGIAGILKEALTPLSAGISVAFVYGSFAKGTETAGSDVDVIVVGNVPFSEIVVRLSTAQDRIGREVNPSVYPVEEFVSKLAGGNHFLSAVIHEPKIFLIGDQNDLTNLVEKRVADRA
jgi:uncharacterized protein